MNLQNQYSAYDLLPDKTLHNAFFTASQRVSQNIELVGESRFSHRASNYLRFSSSQVLVVPDTNPFFVDPLVNSPYLLVGYNFMRDFGPVDFSSSSTSHMSSLAIKVGFRNDWQARLMSSYGRERLDYTAENLPRILTRWNLPSKRPLVALPSIPSETDLAQTPTFCNRSDRSRASMQYPL